jgi:hypothetical protein
MGAIVLIIICIAAIEGLLFYAVFKAAKWRIVSNLDFPKVVELSDDFKPSEKARGVRLYQHAALQLQNEIAKSGALKIEDGKVRLKVVIE